MSWLSSALHAVDKGIHKVPIVGGHIPSAASLLGGSTLGGVGQLAGSALNHTLGSDITKGAQNAAAILPFTGAVGAGSGSIPGLASIGGFLKDHAGDLGGLLKGAGSFLGGNSGLNALGIAQGVNAANLGKQATDYGKKSLGAVEGSYNAREPLRVAGLQGMLHPQTNDLSSLTAHSGPYGKGLPAIKPAAAYLGGTDGGRVG